jgi:threonine dehydrogenase-like Zn-dependent dehydrogenase
VEQLVLTEPGRAQWTDVPEPTLTGDVDALVRPIAVATCDLDTWVNGGRFPLPLPYALGHEFVAEVLSVGAQVSSVKPGDVVAVPFQINCGDCTWCRRGLTESCGAVPRGAAYGLGSIGGEAWGGAVTEVVRVPFADAMLLPLPTGVAPAAVASLDNLPDGWRTVGPYLPDLDDKRALVVGGASIGLYAVAVARALGAEVVYVDDDPHRTSVATGLGATVLAPGVEKVGRFPVTVNTSASARGLHLALTATEPGGVCTDTGIYVKDVALPLWRMYTVGMRFVTARVSARTVLPAVLDLVASGRLDPSIATATTASFLDAPKAWSGHRHKLVLLRSPFSPAGSS